MNIFLSPCVRPAAASFECAELRRLAELCRTEDLNFVSNPETADLIFVVEIYEACLHSGLRQNRVWQKWPAKSFAYCEGDIPTNFLHGLYSSASKALSGSGRFQGCAYALLRLSFPNPCPSAAELASMPKDFLFSFVGRATDGVRWKLFAHHFNRADVFIKESFDYDHFTGVTGNSERARRRYWETAGHSKYALCPRGHGISSIRIFEMMEAGIAPVIISDNWLPPVGPSWEEFALFVPENEIGSIYEKVKAHEGEYADRGRLARQAWEQYFSPEKYWSFILASVRRIQENQKYPESLYVKSLPLLIFQQWSRQRRIHTPIRLRSRLKKMAGFLGVQIIYLFRTLPYRQSWRHRLRTLVEGVHLLLGYIRLKFTLRFSTRAAPVAGKTCVAVLLTYSRPQNMQLVVQAALRNRFVTRVIVSNRNTQVKIRDWVSSTDPRLILVDETTSTQRGHRLILARQTGAEYVVSMDEDILLTPKQWKKFFEFLLADEQCPHGIIGHVYRPGITSSNGSPFHHIAGRDTEVDVLIGAYACTSEHLKRAFDLAAKIGVSDLSQLRNGEDILLSFAGTTQPRIHPLKPVLFCASAGLPGFAFTETYYDSWDERVRIFEKVRAARLAMKK